MRRLCGSLVIPLLFLAVPSEAIEPGGCSAKDTETAFDAFDRCTEVIVKPRKEAEEGTMDEAVAEAMKEATEKVTSQATGATPADGSGSRVSDSLTDLLPLLQGAITPVNTEGGVMPVVLNFNSPPIFRGKTTLQATLAEPEIFAPLEEAIVTAARSSETKQLLDRAGGFGDATYSLGWAPISKARNWSTTRHMFGRDPELYRNLIEEFFEQERLQYAAKIAELSNKGRATLVQTATKLANVLNKDEPDVNQVFRTTFAELKTEAQKLQNRGSQENALSLIDQLKQDSVDLAPLEAEAELLLPDEDQLTALIANQPNLQVRASYRDADFAVGPRNTAFTVEYSAGSLNFNRLLDEYRLELAQRSDTKGKPNEKELQQAKKEAFRRIAARAVAADQWRTAYAISYSKISDYEVNYEYDVDGVMNMAEVNVPGVAQWKLRANYSQLAGPKLLADDVRPRIEFSLEGTWIQEDADIPEAMRRNDRVLGRITYTVPMMDNMTIPVSIVYANRPEFLMEDEDFKRNLSAHVGLSYKLPNPSSQTEQ